MSRSSRWLAGALLLAIVGVVTVYVLISSDDEESPRAEPSEEPAEPFDVRASDRSTALESSSSDTPRSAPRVAPRIVDDAGPPRGAAIGSTAPVDLGRGSPESPRPEIPPDVLLRRSRVLQGELERRIAALHEQREAAVAAGETGRLVFIDRHIERLEAQRPEVEARLRELERQAAAHPAP